MMLEARRTARRLARTGGPKKAGPIVGAILVTTLALAATACGTSPAATPSGSSTPTATIEPGTGFGPALENAAAGDKWWLTAPKADIKVSGPANFVVRVFATLVPTPCGPASITFGGTDYQVTGNTRAAALVNLDSNGSGVLPVAATSSFCQPRNERRTLYALLADPTAAALGAASGPVVDPAAGFYDREGNSGGAGNWLGSPTGSIAVLGKPGANVNVSMSLIPTPCGPATVEVADKTYDVAASTSAQTSVTLSAAGTAQIPIKATSKPCSPSPDVRTLYVLVYNPQATG